MISNDDYECHDCSSLSAQNFCCVNSETIFCVNVICVEDFYAKAGLEADKPS